MTMTQSSPSCLAASLPGCLDRTLEFARLNFGITAWRPLQARAIEADLVGLDSLVIQGTGCGKSLCFQVPAMMRSGLTLVVSPLIALMKNQIDELRARGLPAETLNSTVHHRDHADIMQRCTNGSVRMLYVSPELASQPSFLTFLCNVHRAGRLQSIVVDEAHCIAQWGHDFRPAYGRLGALRVMFPDVPMHCFTATARPEVREQIISALQLRNPAVLVGAFTRPELHLAVHCGRRVDRDLVDEVRELSAKHGSGLPHAPSGIVYCITKAETERIAEILRDSGVRADYYHGDADDKHRENAQERFLCSSPDPTDPCIDVVVATVAFGMGINKPDVRFVVHWGLPSCLEVYHQEIGRAARDGKPADCVMFTEPRADGDAWRAIFEMESQGSGQGGYISPGKIAALKAMQQFAETVDCRHAVLARYFWEITGAACRTACDKCIGARLT